jgi:transcription elongation factor GreA
MAKDIILTPEGRVELEQELLELETTKRAEIGERIKIAREFGDISENSEYDDAKNEQARMEGRILWITQTLANATVVDTPKRSNKVSIGNVVTVLQPDGSERVFTLVGAAEADISTGRISNESPVGAALLGAKKGDTVIADSPSGKKLEFTIVKIGK